MNIQPEELKEKGYVLLDTLDHKELVPFIKTYIRKRTRYSIFYKASNIVILLFAAYLFTVDSPHSIGTRFSYLAYGFALAFLLVPLHEYIHVLAYRNRGAKNTSYDMNLKKFYFMAVADRFVANKKEFEYVALAPFAIISLVLIALLFVVKDNWFLTITGILLTHTAMCSGDFGLLSYFEYHKEKKPVTYDDAKNKITYFYAQKTT